MSTLVKSLIAVAVGFISAFVSLLLDALTGEVTFYWGWVHSWALIWGGLSVVAVVFAWALNVVEPGTVLAAFIGLASQIVSAWILSFVLPLIGLM